MGSEKIVLLEGESETFSEVQHEVLFLGVRNEHSLYCFALAGFTFFVAFNFSNMYLAFVPALVVFFLAFRKCQEMCKINPYWLDYMAKQNYGNKLWIGG